MVSPARANLDADSDYLGVPVDWVVVTASATKLTRAARALRCSADATITVKTAGSGSTERTMLFLAGETRYGVFTHVTGISAGTVEAGI